MRVNLQADERDLTRHKLYIAMEEFLKRFHVSHAEPSSVPLLPTNRDDIREKY